MNLNKTPILIIFFNRPKILENLLNSLGEFKPSELFFACDGARAIGDNSSIFECKKIIQENISWDCTVKEFSSEENFGCDVFVPKAIDWFFSHVESGIILEDDCLISEEFYSFASELLVKYFDEHRVMNISAPNFQVQKWGNADYYFSRYPLNWGWATWRRAWSLYDSSLKDVNDLVGKLDFLNGSPSEEKRYWIRFFRGLYAGKYTYWDAKWVYSMWKNGGISISPNVNLSSNIGFGESATHTKKKLCKHNLPISKISKPLRHPGNVECIYQAADYFQFLNSYRPTWIGRCNAIFDLVRRIL